ALLLGADTALQTFTLRNLPPEYSSLLQSFERGPAVQTELGKLGQPANAQPSQAVTVDSEQQTMASAPQMVAPTAIPQPTTQPTTQPTPKPMIALQDMGQAPELTGITQWWNSKPLTLADLRGKVVIVDFWTYACYNCATTRPYVQALYQKYHDQGLEIIGVHTPELSFE